MGSACGIVGRSTERRPRSDTVTTWPSALVDAELRASALVDNPESRAACGQTEEHPTTGQREAPDGSPWGHADEPTGALGPRRGQPRTDTLGGHHREHPTAPAEGGVRDIGTPASGTGRAVEDHRHCWHCYADARCRQPAWDISTDARYIPLAMTTTPSQCRQPPRGADNARPCEARHRPASPLGESPGLVPLPPGYAHKDPDLRNTRCAQRLDSALVCDPVFPNSLPCVRHQEERAPRPMNPRPRQSQPRPRA